MDHIEFASDSGGCGSFVVFKMNYENNMGVAVMGSREQLNLSKEEQTFDLSKTSSDILHVEIVKYIKLVSAYYCDDVAGDEIEDLWTSTSGKVKIQIMQDFEDGLSIWDRIYIITVKIENIVLENSKGDKIKIDYLDFNNVRVGFLPG
ncbi:MAG: hypothetical protein LBE91_08990 [Tannerella sp.]|nr:hypothetical protein [Tannerella sp.]